MQVTTDYLYTQFDAYNRLCFDSALRRPVIAVSNAKRLLGVFSPTKPLPTIKVSGYYDRTEKDYIDTLVHEMIHMYIYEKGIKDTSSHGKVFRRMMAEINSRAGLSMTISAKTQEWQPARADRRKRYVLFLEMADGRFFISVVATTHVKRIDAMLSEMADRVRKHVWFFTNDPYFSRFSCVRTLRGKQMKPEEYHKKLEEMERLADISRKA